MDKSWLGWVAENLARGCAPEEILGILLQHYFPVPDIRAAMGDKFPAHSPLINLHPSGVGVDYHALAHIRITQLHPPTLTRIDTAKMQLYVLEDFMTQEECDALVKIILPTLRPSTVTYGPDDYRTSTTSDLALLHNKTVEALDHKIATMIGIRLPYSEGIQAQKYKVGEQFKPHTDWFAPGTEEYKIYASALGNRTWTFMVYLNDTPKGGGTRFVKIDKIFYPKRGRAVIWNNLYENGSPNPDTMHWGMPVEEGEKIIITKWFREKGSGPMF